MQGLVRRVLGVGVEALEPKPGNPYNHVVKPGT